MAWLIALALFLWLGQSLGKLSDNVSHKQYEAQRTADDEILSVKSNIYIIAWKICLDKQLELRDLVAHGALDQSHRTDWDFIQFMHQQLGMSVQKYSVFHAVQELVERGEPILLVRTQNYQTSIRVCHSMQDLDLEAESDHIRSILPPLRGCYSPSTARKASDPEAIKIGRQVLNGELPSNNTIGILTA